MHPWNATNTAPLDTHSYDIIMPIVSRGLEYESCPYIAWVNGTKLMVASVCGGSAYLHPQGLESSFPYTRLATATPFNSTLVMFYHQINATVFVEDTWDVLNGVWMSEIITIQTW